MNEVDETRGDAPEQEPEQESLVVEGEGEVPREFQDIVDEVNARFADNDDRVAVGGWLNRVAEFTQNTILSTIGPVMGVPLDSEFVPIMPEDVLEYEDGQQVVVLAVDSKGNVYYDVDGGPLPTSVASPEQFKHARRKLTPQECLEWFEENIDLVDDAERRAEVYDRCVDMLRDAFALEV